MPRIRRATSSDRRPPPRPRWAHALGCALFVWGWAHSASAQSEEPDTLIKRPQAFSRYEREILKQALDANGGTIDPDPDGKIIERIDFVSHDVFEAHDWLPASLTPIANFFHVTSRSHVLESSLLVSVGMRYDKALVEETARNLRGLPQLSLVLIVPLRAAANDHVRLVVITKDVWSLRLNYDFIYENGRLQRLSLQPTEENLFGTHQVVLANFYLDGATMQLGGTYTVPRVAGSRLRASGGANVILSRETGQPEGVVGSLVYEKPLYSTRTPWAWNANISWDYSIHRQYIGGLFTDFDPRSQGCVVSSNQSLTPDASRCLYRSDAITGGYSVTRSLGTVFKHDVGMGISANRSVYQTQDLSFLSPAGRTDFLNAFVPVSDTRIGPFVELHDYSATYLRLIDFDTLGLVENVQFGHGVTLRLTPITKALRSSRDFVDVYAAGSYVLPLGDGLVRAGLVSDAELGGGSIPDGLIDADLRIATPRFGIGRVVLDARIFRIVTRTT